MISCQKQPNSISWARTSPRRALKFATTLLVIFPALSIAQGSIYCNSLFESGRDRDELATLASDIWDRTNKRFYEKILPRTMDRLKGLVALGESREAYDAAREEALRLSEFAEVILEQTSETRRRYEDVEEALYDLESECGVPGTIEDWYEAKEATIASVIESLKDSRERLVVFKREIDSWHESPGKLLARIELLEKEF